MPPINPAIRHRLIRLLLLAACALPGLAGARPNYPFAVSTERNGDGHDIIASNRGPAPVSVRLTLDASDNVRTSQPLPVSIVVRPHSEFLLLQVRPERPGRGLRFSTQTTFSIGNFYAHPDARATYRLPYADGRRFVISQAPGGPLTTHTAEDSAQAVDFTMPENTPIVAAREGTVIAVEAKNSFGGKDRDLLAMANYVRILHADQTIATYAHLAPGGVRVSPGQQVAAGALIGLSGATGYASGPHLHFVVQRLERRSDGFATVSVPIRFHVGNPPYVFTPQFRQAPTADYSSPGRPPPFASTR
jgi:murein DD-endopeptidase MepM/ murein hydrolase activator NlpD